MKLSRQRVGYWLDRTGASALILHTRARTRVPMLSVLCYHSVGDPDDNYRFDPDVIDVTPAGFRQQLRSLQRHFTVIGIDTLCEGLATGTLPPNPVLISFDDGYRSCADTALPILQEFGFSATFFIATHYVTNRCLYWWDKIHYLIKTSANQRIVLNYPEPLTLDLHDRAKAAGTLLRLVKRCRDLDLERFFTGLIAASGVAWSAELEARLTDELIMGWDDIRKLRQAGMDIQSHTRRHRVLQTLSDEHLADELAGSRADIEREIGTSVRTVAYPVGYSIRDLPKLRRAVQDAGYEIGFTNATGVNYLWRRVDPFDVRRMAMERELSMEMFRSMLAVPILGHPRTSWASL